MGILMDEIEIGLGVTVLLLSIFSILFINFGVVPSPQFPGHYTYSISANNAEILLLLILVVGFIAIVHGAFKKRILEFLPGFLVLLWGGGALLWVSLSLHDGAASYIKSFPTDVIETWLSMVPGIVLGIILALDGIRRKTLPSNQNP